MNSLKLLLGIALVAKFSNAVENPITVQQACDGFNQPCTIELIEGYEQWISLSLDEPIICDECSDCSEYKECSVVVNFTIQHAPGSNDAVAANQIIKIDPCYVRWTKDEWQHTKRVRVTALTSYRHTSSIKLIASTGVVSRSEYYMNQNPGDLFIESVDRGTATCSSVGDPHYTSFDGRYWNYYDSGETTLYRAIDRDFAIQTKTHINSNWPSNSVNCLIGGREGKDVVMVDFCGGQGLLTTNYNSDNPEAHPRVDVRGNSYSVYFNSGAYFHASWAGHYMNINVGGIDLGGRSCGLCGNADGNPSNDKSGSITSVGGLDACSKVPSVIAGGTPTERMTSIFSWKYNSSEFKTEVFETPDVESGCPYTMLTIVKPIVATDDIEDITEQLEKLQEDRRNGGNTEIITMILDDEDDDGADDADEVDLSGLTDAQLVAQCQAACNAEAVTQCSALYSEFKTIYAEEMEGCKDDIKDMGQGAQGKQITTFLEGINSAVVELCITFVIQNGDETDPKLTQLLCNGAKKGCGEHGTCASNASCICETNWGGTDCTVDLIAAPTITAISDLVYDVNGLQKGRSPSEVVVYGFNFHKNNEALCRWGNPTQTPCTEDHPECFATMTTRAYYAGVNTFICYVPTFEEDTILNTTKFRQLTGQKPEDPDCEGKTCFNEFEHNGVVPLSMNFSISNNGAIWSTPAALPFKYFDSRCLNCSAAGNCVQRTSGSCVVGEVGAKKCYLEGESDPENGCLECLPDLTTTDLVYSFASKTCKPQMYNRVAKYDIFGSATTNQVIVKGCLDSTLALDEQCVGLDVRTIPDATVKYIYEPGADRINCREAGFAYDNPPQYFNVSETTGAIFLTKDIDIGELPFTNTAHAADHPCLFAGDFNIKAQVTVPVGNSFRSYTTTLSYTHIIVDLLPADFNQIAFQQGGFNGTIVENSPNGAPVLDLEGNPLIIKLVDDPRFADTEGNFKWASQALFGAFAVNADTGAVTVANSNLVDREAAASPRFNATSGMATSVIEASLGFGYHIENVRILVTDINEAATSAYANCTDVLTPCNYSVADRYFNLPENTPVGTTVGVLQSVDPEVAWNPDAAADFSYSVSDPENVLSVVFEGGVWVLQTTKMLDFEADKTQWAITITSVDTALGTAPEATVATSITIDLSNVDEAPTNPILISQHPDVVIDGDKIKVNESVPPSVPIAIVTSVDPDAGDPDGDCTGVCGVVKDGVVHVDQASQDLCPFEVTANGEVERKISLCLDNDNTQSDLAFQFQCTFGGPDGAVQSSYFIVVVDSNQDEAHIDSFSTPFTDVFITENQEDEGNVERNKDMILGDVKVKDETRTLNDPFKKSDFTLDRDDVFVISAVSPGVEDGVVTITLEISLLRDAFVDLDEFECDGCFIVQDTCDGKPCSRVPIGISIAGTPLDNCIKADNIPYMNVIDTQDAPYGLSCGQLDPDCQGVIVPEAAQVGFSIINFTIVDDDPSDYSVSVSSSSPFGVRQTSVGGNRRALYSVYELFVKDPAKIIAAQGEDIRVGVTVQENGAGGATVGMLMTIKVQSVPVEVYPLTDIFSPATFSYGYCDASQFKMFLTKPGINSTKYPDALSQFDGQITWSISYDIGQPDFIQLTPSSDTQSVDLSVKQGVVPPTDGTFVIFANTDIEQEVYFSTNPVERYGPKFNLPEYEGVISYEVEDGVNTQLSVFMPSATASDFDTTTGVEHKLEISVVSLVKASSLSVADATLAVNANQGVYLAPLCSQSNRYVNAKGYSGNAQVYVWTKVDAFSDTDCNDVFTNPADLVCQIKYLSTAPLNVSYDAGALPATPGGDFEAGTFLMANWRDVDSQYSKVSSFVSFSVNSTETRVVVIEIGVDESTSDGNGVMGAGLIVGIVIILLVILLLVAAGYFYNQKRKVTHDELFDGKGSAIYDQNPSYYEQQDILYESNTDWIPGVTNPMYDWYMPTMSRKDCSDNLQQQGEGAYIVRDSEANKGWHMLGVKSQNRVIHDKIRLTENSEYQLLPSVGDASSIAQPTFSDLPELVGYYEQDHPGMDYKLEGSNPIYDNNRLQSVTRVSDGGALNVPMKNREYASAGPVNDNDDRNGGDSVGNPMYFSGPDNNAVYSQADGYLDVKGLPQPGTFGYLDVDPVTEAGMQKKGYMDVNPQFN